MSIHSKSNFLIKDWNESQPSLQFTVYSLQGFKFSKNFLLMNYKLNKILSQTSKRNADLSHTNSWGHKLYNRSTHSEVFIGIEKQMIQ